MGMLGSVVGAGSGDCGTASSSSLFSFLFPKSFKPYLNPVLLSLQILSSRNASMRRHATQQKIKERRRTTRIRTKESRSCAAAAHRCR
ncbi:uncharacterized protein G2W53_034106 [Senna tora]|uniref:Uncharacterized protein n=1 Tax=Senna tora TaxID=362788 RepID=A0A834SZU5_9FABA|nr:uncharacterized protein G2W53_034106 [Senna tora]